MDRKSSSETQSVTPNLPSPRAKKNRSRAKAPAVAQRREQIGERLAMMLVTSFVVIWLVLVLMALTKATTSDELFDIAGQLFPILVTLLAPILHHYFGRGRNDKDA